MTYRNSVAIIWTRKENVVGCHMVFTKNYRKLNPNQFDYEGYDCNEFEILETVGGNVIVSTSDKLEYSGAEIKNKIIISGVTEIEILTEHEL